MLGQNYCSYIPLLIKVLIVFIDLLGQIQMLESSCNRFGLGSSLYAKCSGCGMSELLATGSHSQDDVNPRTLQGKDVNRRMVFAAFESGIGKEGVAKFCEVFNMPFNMSPDTWYSHGENLML